MTDRTFPRCLKTDLRISEGPGHRSRQITYLLPYAGNLTAARFDELAKRLAHKIAKHYSAYTFEELKDVLEKRLRSEWYTGRERDVSVERDEFGTFKLKGENWFCFGYKLEDFVVVDEVSVPAACTA